MKTKTITIEGHIYQTHYHWEAKGQELYSFYATDVSSDNTVLVQPHTITVEIPANFDPRPKQIAYLREQQQKLQAATFGELHRMNDEINKLLAIEGPSDQEVLSQADDDLPS